MKAKQNPGRILVVDDEPLNRELLEIALDAAGYVVVQAHNGQQALELMETGSFDVVVLDLMMPVMNGFEACSKIRENPAYSQIPVIVATAAADRESRLRAIECGANELLTKPLDLHEVELRVANAVKLKRLYDEVDQNFRDLQQLQRHRDNLTNMLVHDIRSPLTAIVGFHQLLRMDLDGVVGGETLEYLDVASESAEKIARMLTELLDIQRLEEGRLELRRVSTGLTSLVSTTLTKMVSLLEGRTLEIQEVPDSCRALVDAELVGRTIENLFSNVCKYTPRGTHIRIGIREVPHAVEIFVADNGPGIPLDQQAAIFERFNQGGRTGARSRGCGLGLTFCRLVMHAHGGEISVKSESSQGSEFCLRFPV
ncbi:MAG: hybrid sensor histidine kinase/response regulator [Nannocystaceae bacterium]